MTYCGIEEAIKNGGHAILLLRHAERPPLDPGDTTFGVNLPITERGRETARRYGIKLSGIVEPSAVRTYASETLRTRQTAACIWEGLTEHGRCNPSPVTLLPELGGGSPFFGRLDERMALISEGCYLDRLNDYFREGTQIGYKPLAAATAKMDEVLCGLAEEDVSLIVAVTHDINVASFLAGRGIETGFDERLWPHYLDAAVIIRMGNGESTYGYFRRAHVGYQDIPDEYATPDAAFIAPSRPHEYHDRRRKGKNESTSSIGRREESEPPWVRA